MIDGARQVGKTFIIEELGRTHSESVIKIDFVKMKGAVELFQNVEDEKNSLRIRAVFDRLAPELNKKNKRFFAGNLDETPRFDRLEDEFIWLTAFLDRKFRLCCLRSRRSSSCS